ncbi:MAG: serine/threonine-protein kinase [Myxococcota bacterium]|nr:serine/threonine-protein kinase [Myxococcota bacterium]
MRPSKGAGGVRQVEIRPEFIEQIEGLEMFGDFVLLKPMGLGGMSEIRLAFRLENQKFDEVCVVKRLLNYAGENNQSMEMFRDEARIGRLIQHPNVVHQLEAGRVGKVPYIALELVDGINLFTLSRLMDDDLIPLNIVMDVGISVARALHQAHTLRGDRGQPLDFVHRDITPHNILISRDGVVKLSDFGIAKYRGAMSQTEVGVTKGKRGYGAPEYLQGEKATAAADIFSLAVVLAELCVGKQLFEDSCIDVPDLEFHLRASLDTRLRPIPAGLRELLVKMMNKSPAARPSSALEIVESLESLLEATDKSVTLQDLAAEKVKLRSPPIDDVIDEFLKWTQEQQAGISDLHQSAGQDPFYPRDETPQHIANLFSSSSEELLYVSNFFPTTSDFAVLGREYFDQSDAEQQAFVREAAEYSENFPASSIPKLYSTPDDDMVSDTYLRPPPHFRPDDSEDSLAQESSPGQRARKGQVELESKTTSRGQLQPHEVPAWFVVISVVFTFAVGFTAYLVIRHFVLK